MEDQLTPEQIQNHINAAFDSVGLINGVVAGTQMENANVTDKKDTIERNIGHLNIMLGKEWFSTNLTEQQTTDINNCITAGNTYIAEN